MFFRNISGGMRMAVTDTVTELEVHDVRFPPRSSSTARTP